MFDFSDSSFNLLLQPLAPVIYKTVTVDLLVAPSVAIKPALLSTNEIVVFKTSPFPTS